jgi:predicted AlkP superfamily phosphohydrolase/phosphomutase
MSVGKKRVVIIGIDGVPFGLIKDLSNRGVMPNFKALRKEGQFVQMESTIPEVSSVSWSSMITGVNPGKHGIFGFSDLIPGTYTMSFPNFKNLKYPPFWRQWPKKKHVVINVPSTYPPTDINGFIVSGFVSLDLEKAVRPPDYVQELQKLGYKIDVDASKAHKSIPLFFKDLFSTHEKRVDLYRYMWEKIDWDVFMLVFTGSDRLEHFLWNAYADPHSKYHEDFLKYFTLVDEAIGEINNKLNEDDSLIMLSDHGMEGITTNVNINRVLRENDLLSIGDTPKKRYNNLKAETQAFALEPARIHLNRKKKYPRGSVGKNQETQILDKLIDIFYDLEYKNQKVIRRVCKRNEIFSGLYSNHAPDLVLLPHSGYCLRGGLTKNSIFDLDMTISGMHTQQDAFLFIKSNINQFEIPEYPRIDQIINLIKQINLW